MFLQFQITRGKVSKKCLHMLNVTTNCSDLQRSALTAEYNGRRKKEGLECIVSKEEKS